MTIDLACLQALRQYSTPAVLNALKKLGHQPEDMQTIDPAAIDCQSPALGPMVGFASTRTVHTTRQASERPDTSLPPWSGVEEVAGPRIMVIRNTGDTAGPIAMGEILANLFRALDCVGVITDGRVRDIGEMEEAGLAIFAAGLGPGGGYVDVVEVNQPVEIGGISIAPGDLLHGDRHGIAKIPLELAAELPAALARVEADEKAIVELCRSPGFTMEKFLAALKAL